MGCEGWEGVEGVTGACGGGLVCGLGWGRGDGGYGERGWVDVSHISVYGLNGRATSL